MVLDQSVGLGNDVSNYDSVANDTSMGKKMVIDKSQFRRFE